MSLRACTRSADEGGLELRAVWKEMRGLVEGEGEGVGETGVVAAFARLGRLVVVEYGEGETGAAVGMEVAALAPLGRRVPVEYDTGREMAVSQASSSAISMIGAGGGGRGLVNAAGERARGSVVSAGRPREDIRVSTSSSIASKLLRLVVFQPFSSIATLSTSFVFRLSPSVLFLCNFLAALSISISFSISLSISLSPSLLPFSNPSSNITTSSYATPSLIPLRPQPHFSPRTLSLSLFLSSSLSLLHSSSSSSSIPTPPAILANVKSTIPAGNNRPYRLFSVGTLIRDGCGVLGSGQSGGGGVRDVRVEVAVEEVVEVELAFKRSVVMVCVCWWWEEVLE